jgi:hypothetical protein
LIVLDPFQNGVVDAITITDLPAASQRLARIDIKAMQLAKSPDDVVIQTFETIVKILRMRQATGVGPCFTGILLACYEGGFAQFALRDIAESISKLGLLVYLETSAPGFLDDAKILDSDSIAGLLICNATILSSGEKRDVFQMMEMRPLIKAFMSQSCLRKFVVLVWDVVKDGVQPSKPTLKRAFQLCRFYNALAWISSESAVECAYPDGSLLEPLGAFDWLKESRVMSFHNTWISNDKVSFESTTLWSCLTLYF